MVRDEKRDGNCWGERDQKRDEKRDEKRDKKREISERDEKRDEKRDRVIKSVRCSSMEQPANTPLGWY
jgi:hypothetical protein